LGIKIIRGSKQNKAMGFLTISKRGALVTIIALIITLALAITYIHILNVRHRVGGRTLSTSYKLSMINITVIYNNATYSYIQNLSMVGELNGISFVSSLLKPYYKYSVNVTIGPLYCFKPYVANITSDNGALCVPSIVTMNATNEHVVQDLTAATDLWRYINNSLYTVRYLILSIPAVKGYVNGKWVVPISFGAAVTWIRLRNYSVSSRVYYYYYFLIVSSNGIRVGIIQVYTYLSSGIIHMNVELPASTKLPSYIMTGPLASIYLYTINYTKGWAYSLTTQTNSTFTTVSLYLIEPSLHCMEQYELFNCTSPGIWMVAPNILMEDH